MAIGQLHNRLLSGSNARHFSTTYCKSKITAKTKGQVKTFDERIINCTYTIQEHLLEIAVWSLIMFIDYQQSLTNANILGQGNLNLVSEKSEKSQGILLSISCGNPVLEQAVILFSCIPFQIGNFS